MTEEKGLLEEGTDSLATLTDPPTLCSIAISLKRIADIMEKKDTKDAMVLPGGGGIKK